MSRTWIWITLIGLVLTVVTICGIRVGNSYVKWIESRKVVDRPPQGYAELFKGPDSGNLQFQETTVDRYRNPIARYKYRHHGIYEILETRIDFSTKADLSQKLKIVQAEIPSMGLTDTYDQINV